MFVLVELRDLLSYYHKIISTEFLTHFFELANSVIHKHFCGRSLNKISDLVQMSHCHMIDLIRVGTREELIFDSH